MHVGTWYWFSDYNLSREVDHISTGHNSDGSELTMIVQYQS